jgi:hypothetical protein
MPYMPGEFRFEIVPDFSSNRPRSVARYTCDSCPATHHRVVHSGKVLNPELIAKHAQRDGWIVPGRRRGKIICPECQAARRAQAKGEPPGKVVALFPPPAKPFMPPIIHDPSQAEIPMAAPPPTPQPSAPPSLIGSVQTELTQQQRLNARSLLDKHFDDGDGAYLDGWTDQKIADQVGAPRALISKLREVAYGPIRVDPELVGLRAALTDAERKLAEHERFWREAMTKAQAEIKALRDQLAGIEKKRAA